MPATVVTLCTNRKRSSPLPSLCARTLAPGSTAQVAESWGRRLRSAPDRQPATALYAGRSFREAERAARMLNAPLFIVSAGLGLVGAGTCVPTYSVTLSPGSLDSVLPLIAGSPADWWDALADHSPFHAELPAEGPVLAALSAPYLRLVGRRWSSWPASFRVRLRLFSKERPAGEAAPLAAAWMPYDDRLDSVGRGYAGTQGDFAQRALRHFVEHYGAGSASAEEDAQLVCAALEGFSAPIVPERRRLADEDIISLIRQEWCRVGGRSGAMLRHLRDHLGIACEQTRFKFLFKQAALPEPTGEAS